MDGKDTNKGTGGRRGKPRPRKVADAQANGDDPAYPAAVIAAILGLTETRVRDLVREGMPKVGRGLFPLKGTVQWYVSYWRDRALGRGGNQHKTSKQATEADILALKLRKMQGEVFERAEVFDTLMGAYARLGNGLETLATRLGRELNLPGDDVKMVRELVDEMRSNFVRDCGEFIEVVEKDEQPRKGNAA